MYVCIYISEYKWYHNTRISSFRSDGYFYLIVDESLGLYVRTAAVATKSWVRCYNCAVILRYDFPHRSARIQTRRR